MKKFMDENFLLDSKTAEHLYHNYAKKMPIFDYHCHLPIKEIYEDKKFSDLTEVWLGAGDGFGDHYKWRALRARGINEEMISMKADAKSKFMNWAETVPYTIGNPLYHWVHLELQRFFDVYENLSLKTAESIWTKCNNKLATLTARKMIEESNVDTICTTDDPIDSLEWHIKLKKDKSFKTKVFPAFRPDKAINVELSWFSSWVAELSKVVNFNIEKLDDLLKALEMRIDFFHEVGCRVSDHALDVVNYAKSTKDEANKIFAKGMKGEPISLDEQDKYKGYILVFLGKQYAKRNWVQQYHIGALRNNSKRMLEKIGPDTGFDAINDANYAPKLAGLLGELDGTDELPKTILYNLNPRDNELLAVMAGCFMGEGVKGKIQFGSGWWFLDQKDGMKKQLETLSQVGLLSNFVGMLTDSRSFLSYTRHEYFRRILCNKIGALIENGEYPNELEFVGKIVQDICFNNAKNYFKI